MQEKTHWENVYCTKDSTELSWFQSKAKLSLQVIHNLVTDTSANIIDVGGGASTLVDDLILLNYHKITVLDLSGSALKIVKNRLKNKAKNISWLQGNILEISLKKNCYDVWHDRAVFHFLTRQTQRQAYIKQVARALKPDGLLIISTFASDGPQKCSGLPVVRYTARELYAHFSDSFDLLNSEIECHFSPAGKEQKFVYCICKKAS